MTAGLLRERWLRAIRVAGAAVDAAARADALSAEQAVRHRRLLVSERAWFGSFAWSTVRLSSSPNAVSAPSLTPERSERGLLRRTTLPTRLEVDNAQAHHHGNRSLGPCGPRRRRHLAARGRHARPRLPLVPGRRQVHEVRDSARPRHAHQP